MICDLVTYVRFKSYYQESTEGASVLRMMKQTENQFRKDFYFIDAWMNGGIIIVILTIQMGWLDF